jgi:hypothetical protein
MMVKHQCIPLDSPSDWRAALQGIKHGPGHTWEHCYAVHLTSGLKTFLYTFEDAGVRIACPLSEREFGGYTDLVKPYGFSGFVGNNDCPEFSQYWKDFVRQKGYVCGYLGVDPVFTNKTYFRQEESRQYNAIFVLDLTLSDEELFANLSRNRKQQLRHWDKIVSNIVLDRTAVADFFVAHYDDFIHEKGAPSFYYFSRDTLSYLVGLENVFIVGAREGEKLVVVAVFAYTPDAGEAMFCVSLPEGRKCTAMLMWYGIKSLKSLKVPLVNLGGGCCEDDSLAQFKSRFGCQKLPLRSIRQIYEPEIYKQLCKRVNADPNDTTGYFPAYRKTLTEPD